MTAKSTQIAIQFKCVPQADEIELGWGSIGALRAGWAQPGAPPLASCEPGSWGPAEADELLAEDGRAWFQDCEGHG
jgi:glucose-6-phosphate 1-dehydrogenase